jgi:hypothetical protein
MQVGYQCNGSNQQGVVGHGRERLGCHNQKKAFFQWKSPAGWKRCRMHANGKKLLTEYSRPATSN